MIPPIKVETLVTWRHKWKPKIIKQTSDGENKRWVEHVCYCVLPAAASFFCLERCARMFATAFVYGLKTTLKVEKYMNFYKLYSDVFQLLLLDNQF